MFRESMVDVCSHNALRPEGLLIIDATMHQADASPEAYVRFEALLRSAKQET